MTPCCVIRLGREPTGRVPGVNALVSPPSSVEGVAVPARRMRKLPPHRQIAAWILARIESGDLQPGQPVPSEKELVDTFGVARTTARRAIA
jgi:Bacterial regulatory proteins, gntR family